LLYKFDLIFIRSVFNKRANLDYAGFGTTTADAIDTVAVGGTVVLVGMGKLQSTINTSNLILKSVQLKGSVGGTVEDIAAIYELMSKGHLNPLLSEITFDEISDGLGRLERHEVKGRLVANLE
jgi:alcohol dehydrogenase, propanol-preferring